MTEPSTYTIETVPGKGTLIRFSKGDIHERCSESDKQRLLAAAQSINNNPRVVIDLSATSRIGTAWLSWFGRMTAEVEAGGGKLIVAGADATTTKTADLVGARLNFERTVQEAWNA